MTTKQMSNSRFQKGSGVYTCVSCKKATRSTGRGDNEHVRMCEHCYKVAGYVNAINDGEMELSEVPEEYREDVEAEL